MYDPSKLWHESRKIEDLYGLYRGKCENKDDPDRLGRVQIRVWFLHGDTDTTPNVALPWAEVSEISGGGYDFGSFGPPEVGTGVWVLFEGGRIDFPVVIGTFRGRSFRDSDNPNIMLTSGGKPVTETSWKPPDKELETPKEVFEETWSGDPHPTKVIPFKTYKGHTLICENADGMEYMRLIDRSGQMLEMYCPVDKTKQAGNKIQRGTRNAARGDQLPYEAMADRRAIVRLMDLSGQEVKLNASELNESILIKSIGKSTGNENIIQLKSGTGNEGIVIKDYLGDNLTLDPNSSTPIRLEDSSGNGIIFDKELGKVKIISAKKSEEEVKQKSVIVEGECEIDIGGDELKKVGGSIKSTVTSDVGVAALGKGVINLGGTLSVVVSNAPLPGSTSLPGPTATAFEMNVYTGKIIVKTKAGNIDINTLAGNIDINTLVGTANLSATTGLTLKTTLGTAQLDGFPIKLGGNAAAEPLVLGKQWIALFTELIGYINAHTHLTGVGPTIVPNNVANFTSMLAKLSNSVSTFVKTERVRSA